MAKKKNIVQELKQPDQFVDFWTHAWSRASAFIGPRQKPAIAGAVAIVVVVIGAMVFQSIDEGHKEVAADALGRAQKLATADLETPPAAGETPKPAKDDVPRFKTAAERSAAVIKELDDFLAKQSGSPLKDEALLMKGSQLLDVGKPDEAIAAFDGALGAKLDLRLKFLAHEGKGYAFEAKGDLDKAAAAFAELEQDAAAFNGFYKDRAAFQKARIAERKGDKAGALKLYKELSDKAGESLLHDEIADRLAVLEAK